MTLICYYHRQAGADVGPYGKSFHLLLKLAAGAVCGGREGVDDSAFPLRFEVDYVRVHDRKPE